jgi:hypothetical protein
MSAALLMLAMLAWVLMSAAVTGLIMLVTVVHEKTEELRDWSHEPDDSDGWLV